MADQDENVLKEHFWFTATTVTMNGFLLNGIQAITYGFLVKLLSLIVSAFAAYLVIERAASKESEDKELWPDLKDVPGEKKRDRKWREAQRKFHAVLLYTPVVVSEASGSLFYLLLIGASCVGVLLAHAR